MENISSEQELKQLLEEGRITEEEYKELLEALRQKEASLKPEEKPAENENPRCLKSHSGYGRTALILFILSIILPVGLIVLNVVAGTLGVMAWRKIGLLFVPLILVGLLCGLLAFIFGIIGWKSTQGKVAAIGVPCMGLLITPGLLFFLYFSVRVSHQVVIEEAIAHEQAAVADVRARHLESHKTYPMDTLEGLISRDMAEIDEDIYVNGSGSLKIVSDSSEKRTIRLYEIPPWDLEGSILTYRAKLKSLNLNGKAYLEMWCEIPGKGEIFSRGLEQPITGTTDWIKTKIPFRLEEGQRPSKVNLNLVVEGTGIVWIDDIILSSSPLE